MARMIDTPAELAEQMRLVRRIAVASRLEAGYSEDAIYAQGIDIATGAARLEGLCESDVEVAASLARRVIAEALAGARAEVSTT